MAGNTNQVGFGIFTMCAGVFCLATGDAVAKWLGNHYPTSQLIFFRELFSLPSVLILALSTGGLYKLKPNRLWVLTLTGTFQLLAIGSFLFALRFMPLASAWAIAFSGPLMVTVLTPIMLRERVGPLRWTATLAGFVGVLIVLRPGSGAFQWAAVLPLVTALTSSLSLLMARRYAQQEDFAAMVAFMIGIPLLLTSFIMPFDFVEPQPVHWPAFFTLGALSGASITFTTLAYRVTQAANVAPFDYTALIWATLWGWVIWQDVPGYHTGIGAVLIVGSGLFVLYRETVRRRVRRAT